MDTLTHALSGALLARATAPVSSSATAPDVLPLRRRVAIGALAAAFPDSDVVVSWMSPLSYLYHHRGVTHSLIMLALWALLLAWLCSKAWRNGPGWRAYAGVIAWGIGIHIAGDWITSFGTLVFAPFSDWRAALSTTFIIDLWFSGIILAGLLASWLWRRSQYARWPAVAGVAVLCGYVGFQYVLQQRAIEFGRLFAGQAGLGNAKVSAVPRPVSPFNWMVVVEADDRYHYSLISLSRHELPPPLAADAGFFTRMGAPYLPLAHASWVQAARYGQPMQANMAKEVLTHPRFEFFRWFAQYPILYRVDAGNPPALTGCVWFQDLRFFTPGRAAWPFRYGMCREPGGEWRPYELLSDNKASPVY
jgi:inner membrane protein